LCGDKIYENKSAKAKGVIKAFFELPFGEHFFKKMLEIRDQSFEIIQQSYLDYYTGVSKEQPSEAAKGMPPILKL